MPYATATDVQSQFKNLTYSASSAVTEAEVTEFIEQEEAVINATISNRYEIPVTGTEAVKVMKNISIAYVAFRVATILNLKKDVPIPEKFAPQILNEGAKYKEAKEQLKAIQSGKIVLTDAVARSLGQGVNSYNSENSILPLWERGIKQW